MEQRPSKKCVPSCQSRAAPLSRSSVSSLHGAVPRTRMSVADFQTARSGPTESDRSSAGADSDRLQSSGYGANQPPAAAAPPATARTTPAPPTPARKADTTSRDLTIDEG